MRLTRLSIERLPGIGRGFAVQDLADGVTVVTGPNASGKSSLIRALGYLLVSPRRSDPQDLVLSADFRDGEDATWRAERTGTSLTWRRDGEPAPPPPLPDADALQGYLLQVDTLLEAASGEHSLAEQFRRELAGGFDLERIRGEGGAFQVRRGQDRDSANRLRQAQQALREAEGHNTALLRAREELPDLDAGIRQATEARQRVAQCRDALSALEARRERQMAAAALEPFPASMPEGLTETDLTDLEEELESARARCDAVRRDLDRAESDLRDQGLADAGPVALDLRAPRQWSTRLARNADRLAEARERAASARERLHAANRNLGSDAETALRLDTAAARELEGTALRVQSAVEQVNALRAQIQAAESASATDAGGRRQRLLDVLAVLLLLAGGGLTTGVAWLAQPVLTVFGSLLLVAGGPLAGRRLLPSHPGPDAAGPLRIRLERAEEEQQRVTGELQRLAQSAGLPLTEERLPWHFQLLVQRLLEREAAAASLAQAEVACKEILDQQRALSGQLRAFLAPWEPVPDTADTDTLGAALERLEERIHATETARHASGEAGRRLRDADAEYERAEEKLQALYCRFGLTPGERETLLRRIGQLPDWESARSHLQQAQTRESAALERLRQAGSQLREWVEADNTPAIEQHLAAAESDAARYEELVEKRARIRGDIERAEDDHRLEERLAGRDAALEELAERFRDRMLAEAGRFLLEEVESEYRHRHQPQAVREADEALQTFTHHAFSLELDPDGQPRAVEAASGERRTLEALSVGTRMQLLIALRVAWIRQQEAGHARLPLFLDEALTTTDPERFRSVAGALHATAKADRRQVFYLTAQPEDARRWEDATGSTPALIDLAVVRGLAQAAPEPIDLPPPRTIPPPENREAADYAALLGVPMVDPRADAGALHLFHLLRDDLPLLHRLLEDYRVATLGQLEALLQGPLADRVADAAGQRLLRARIQATRAWLDAWRIGRGHPVDRVALELSPAKRWQTLDELAERAAAVGHGPKAFLTSLERERIAGVGPGTIEKIREWMEEEGYLDASPALDRDERHRRMLQAVDATEADTVRPLSDWLEAGTAPTPGLATTQ